MSVVVAHEALDREVVVAVAVFVTEGRGDLLLELEAHLVVLATDDQVQLVAYPPQEVEGTEVVVGLVLGQQAEVKEVVEDKKVPVLRKRVLIKSAFRVFDDEGKPVIGMALQQLLKTKRILLVRTDAKKPTPEQLMKLGGDTLLVFERLKKPVNKPIE